MGKTITIDPVTRISGFLEIQVEVENNIIVDAKTSGLLFRGFETMLEGRAPLDSIFFTERICGICSTAHAMASTMALENALGVTPTLNDSYIRDIMHGFEFLQNHIRQFYYYTIPSYVKMPDVNPLQPQEYKDYRLPQKLNARLIESYEKSVLISRLAHEGLAVLGGKIPHSHGIFVGGVTVNIDPYKLTKIKSIISEIYSFIDNRMIEDVNILAQYYADYFEKGNSYENFMSYGVFNKYEDEDITYVKPSVLINGTRYAFKEEEITQNIQHAWYISDNNMQNPRLDEEEKVDINKKDAYTFVKAPRYKNLPMEVGPLARLKLTSEYDGGNSCMDRNIARVLEARKISKIMLNLANRVELKRNNQSKYTIPEEGFGVGLIDTTRGSLGHWIKIENKIIKYYNIITPTAWNMSPLDNNGVHGVGEKALIGSKISNINEPVEIGRIIRSYDPCISCATHVTGDKFEPIKIKVLV